MKTGFGIIRQNNIYIKEEDGNFILSIDEIKSYMTPKELGDLLIILEKLKE